MIFAQPHQPAAVTYLVWTDARAVPSFDVADGTAAVEGTSTHAPIAAHAFRAAIVVDTAVRELVLSCNIKCVAEACYHRHQLKVNQRHGLDSARRAVAVYRGNDGRWNGALQP